MSIISIPTHLVDDEMCAVNEAEAQLEAAEEAVKCAHSKLNSACDALQLARTQAVLQWEKEDPDGFRAALQPELPDSLWISGLVRLGLARWGYHEPVIWSAEGQQHRTRIGLPKIPQ